MTIDEEIKMYKKIVNTDSNCIRYCMESCEESVEKCKQVLEWLEELKELSNTGYKQGHFVGYSKAIDDFQEWLKYQKIVGVDNVTNDILVAVNGIWEYAVDVFKEENKESEENLE